MQTTWLWQSKPEVWESLKSMMVKKCDWRMGTTIDLKWIPEPVKVGFWKDRRDHLSWAQHEGKWGQFQAWASGDNSFKSGQIPLTGWMIWLFGNMSRRQRRTPRDLGRIYWGWCHKNRGSGYAKRVMLCEVKKWKKAVDLVVTSESDLILHGRGEMGRKEVGSFRLFRHLIFNGKCILQGGSWEYH